MVRQAGPSWARSLVLLGVVGLVGHPALLQTVNAATCAPLPAEALATVTSPVLDAELSGFTADAKLSLVFYQPIELSVDETDSVAHVTTYESAGKTLHANERLAVDPNSGLVGSLDGRDASCFSKYTLTVQDVASWAASSGTVRANENPDFYELRSNVVVWTNVTVLEANRSIPVQQLRRSPLPFALRFPKVATASFLNITTHHPPVISPLLVLQYLGVEFNQAGSNALSASARLRLRTVVQQPYRICGGQNPGPGLAGINNFGDSQAALCGANTIAFDVHGDISAAGASAQIVSDCFSETPLSSGEPALCRQVFEFKFDLNAGVCELDNIHGPSDYRFSGRLRCFGDDSECPLNEGTGTEDTSVSWELVLDSADLCPQTVASLEVASAIAAYRANDFAVQTTNFLEDSTIVLRITIDTLGADASATAVTVTSMEFFNAASVFGTDDPVEVFPDPGGFADLGVVLHASGSNPSGVSALAPNQTAIEFTAASAVFALAADSREDFGVIVHVDVAYGAASSAVVLLGKKLTDEDKTATASTFSLVAAPGKGATTTGEPGRESGAARAGMAAAMFATSVLLM